MEKIDGGTKMNIPEYVKIGWRDYKIVADKVMKATDKGEDVHGEIEYCENEIHLNKEISGEHRNVVLLHEIIHGIFYMTGHERWRKDEELIDTISENLYQVIKDNPNMFEER